MRLATLTTLVIFCCTPPGLATDFSEAYEAFSKGDTKTAERVFLKKLSEPDSKGEPDVQKLMAIRCLNIIYAGRREFAKQELMLKRSAQIERNLPNWDREITLSSLASCYADQHKFQEAENYFKEALKVNEQKRGKNNLDKIPILLNLSTFYADRGRFQEAFNCIIEGVELRKILKLSETAQFSDLRDSAATLFVAAGEYEQAEKALEQRLEASKYFDGPNSIHTADLYKELAEAKGGLGKFAESESLFRKALEIDLASYPKESAIFDRDRMNIARALIEQGKLDESESFVKIAIENYKKRKAQFNPSYGTALAVQASINRKRGDTKSALKLINEALSIHQKLYGEQNQRVIRELSIKAEILRDLKMNAEASRQLQRAMSISKNLLGKEHPLSLKIQKQYDSFTKGS